MSKFRDTFDSAKSCYILPRDDIVAGILIPAFAVTGSVDCMMAFFSANSLAEIAPGLATFLRESQESVRLVISPYVSERDQQALRDGTVSPDRLASDKVVADLPDADELANHTLACLAWLLAKGRLKVKVAVMRDSLFHSKVWLFGDGEDSAALHGSMNMTGAAFRKNREHISLSRVWRGDEAREHVEEFRGEFDSLWAGGDQDCIVMDLPNAIEKEVMRHYDSNRIPSEEEFHRAWRRAHDLPSDPHRIREYERPKFGIPSFIEFERGEFAHQGKAVDAWRRASWNGILDMATGSGKTITAMIGTYFLLQQARKLLVVISAPYRPLIAQWCGEIEMFGVVPVNLSKAGGASKRDGELQKLGRRLRRKTTDIEVVVVSNSVLCTEEFVASLSRLSVPMLLIADECHNLGAAGFTDNPPDIFDFRLGLSATPDRQFDPEGTENLKSYFGDVCYEFSMEEAIGKCLVPYDYYAHEATLTTTEMDEWYELCDKIAEVAWKFESTKSDPYLDNLLRQRRIVLETADAKIGLLRAALSEKSIRQLRYTLVYGTDKEPGQLEAVNDLMNELGLLFHQLTYEETGDRERTKMILDSFQAGDLQVLTAKRVLDEGVNIPQIKLAYILASTTVRRQWVQRRGRLLRTCKEIGKTHAEIHDFVTLPPETSGPLDPDARKLVKSELDRVWEFARLSQNGAEAGGAYKLVAKLQKLLVGS